MQLYKEKALVQANLGRLIAAQSYWDKGWYHQQAIFHLFVADKPVSMPDVGALTAFLKTHRFSAAEVEYLASQGLAERFLNALQRKRLGITMYVSPKNKLLSPKRPLLILKSSYIEAQVCSLPILYFLQPLVSVHLSYDCIAEQDEQGNWRTAHANPASILNFEQQEDVLPFFIDGKIVYHS